MTDEEIAALQERLTAAEEKAKGFDAIKAKNEELLGETKAAKAKAKEESEARQKAADEAAAKNGDVDALNKSWQVKLDKALADSADALKDRDGRLVDLTVNATAQRLAAELSVPGSADVLLPHIKSRLSYQDGKLSVLDSDGKPSASTVEELAKEIAANKAFSPLIVASHATGGGASGGKGGALSTNHKADFGGDKAARTAAIKAKFPDLN